MTHSPVDRYDTRLDIRYAPLEVVDVPALVDAVTHPWYNQTLCKVNDSVVRLGSSRRATIMAQARRRGRVLLVVEGVSSLTWRTASWSFCHAGLCSPRASRTPLRAPCGPSSSWSKAPASCRQELSAMPKLVGRRLRHCWSRSPPNHPPAAAVVPLAERTRAWSAVCYAASPSLVSLCRAIQSRSACALFARRV